MLNLPEHKLYSDEYFQYHSIPLIHIFEIENMLFCTRSVDLVMVKVLKPLRQALQQPVVRSIDWQGITRCSAAPELSLI